MSKYHYHNPLQRLSIFLSALGKVAMLNLFSIVLVILLYLFYWTFPQAKDLLLIINQGGDLWVILFFTSLILMASLCWYLPRFIYPENNLEISKFRDLFFKKMDHHTYHKCVEKYDKEKELDSYSNSKEKEEDSIHNLCLAFLKEMLPRLLGTLVILIASLGILNVGNEMGDIFLWNVSANYALLFSILTLIIIHVLLYWGVNQFQKKSSKRWVNIFIGVSLVAILVISLAWFRNENNQEIQGLESVLLSGILLSIYFLLFTLIRKFSTNPQENKEVETPQGFKKVNIIMLILTIVSSSFMMGFLILNFAPSLSQSLNPLFAANIAFIFYLTLLYYLQIIGAKKRVKIVFLTLSGILLISAFTSSNNFHEIATTKNEFNPSERVDLDTYFSKWITQREAFINNWLDSSGQEKYPIFIVSSEGGGSRAAYWTVITHSYLQNEDSDYYDNHLFALTGASGGTTGNSTFFSLKQGSLADSSLHKSANSMFKQNFLSSSLTMLMGFDMWKDVFGINLGEDRAKELEKEWAEELKIASGAQSPKFDTSFLSFWYEEGTELKDQSQPLLFINTTQVQKGSHAIISPVKLNPHIYLGLDLLDTLYKENDSLTIPLNTATLLNASFPFINPAGNIDSVGSFVDAGYYDNYGARTGKAIIKQLKQINRPQDSVLNQIYDRLEFVSILIRNGTANQKLKPDSTDKPIKPSTTTAQLFAPLSTIANIRSAVNTDNRLELIEVADAFYEIELKRVKFVPKDGTEEIEPIIPLARFLSPLALEAMDTAQVQIKDSSQLKGILQEMKYRK